MFTDSIRDSGGSCDGIRRRAVSLSVDLFSAVGVLSAEVIGIRNDSVFSARITSVKLLFVGRLGIDGLFGVNKSVSFEHVGSSNFEAEFLRVYFGDVVRIVYQSSIDIRA